MTIQAIIDRAESIKFDRRKVVGQAVTRNEIVRVSEAITRNPWRFSVKVSAPISYYTARPIIEQLDKLDRATSEVITFSNNPNLSWMLAYDFDNQVNSAAIAAMTPTAVSGTNVTISGLPPVADTTLMFRQGDFVQFGSYPHPFTVTANVFRGTGASVVLPLHRPVFMSTDVVGQPIRVGNSVQFRMIATQMPTYTIIRGGENGLIVFDSDFELIEFTGNIL